MPTGHEAPWRGKRLLADAFGHLLPREVFTRRKMGFSVPLDHWFRNELKELASDLLLTPSSRCHDFLRPERLNRLWDAHQTGQFDHSSRKGVERIIRGSDLPIAIHAEVNDEGVAAVEAKQLVLAAPLDTLDSSSSRTSRERRRELAFERGMNRSHRSNRFAEGGASQGTRRTLDLWEFWHLRQTGRADFMFELFTPELPRGDGETYRGAL